MRHRRSLGILGLAFAGALLAAPVQAEEPKHGGILRIYHRDSPASASILEESTFSTNIPFMGVYNNLVLYDQHKPQNSIDTIVPELADVTTNGDNEATFNLKRPQPSFIALLASGYSPIYPCHVSTRDMRVKPIGTGPFKFVEFKQNESIKIARNPDYWKKGCPYLDGIEFTIIPNRSTAILAFIAGKFDMTFPT